jgi:sulfopyruvate decarboxylase TPP-binding subunit
MKLNKKHLAVTALLSATAMTSAFAASSSTGATITVPSTHKRGGYNQVQSAEQKTAMAAALAHALGTTPEAVTAQLNAGKTPQDIIKASGLDATTVKAQLEISHEADMKAHLATDVSSGKITQAQADAMLLGGKNHKDGKRGMGMKGVSIKNNDSMLTNMATVLGTTKDSLQAQITAGKTVTDIVKAAGKLRSKRKLLRVPSLKLKPMQNLLLALITPVDTVKLALQILQQVTNR